MPRDRRGISLWEKLKDEPIGGGLSVNRGARLYKLHFWPKYNLFSLQRRDIDHKRKFPEKCFKKMGSFADIKTQGNLLSKLLVAGSPWEIIPFWLSAALHADCGRSFFPRALRQEWILRLPASRATLKKNQACEDFSTAKAREWTPIA